MSWFWELYCDYTFQMSFFLGNKLIRLDVRSHDVSTLPIVQKNMHIYIIIYKDEMIKQRGQNVKNWWIWVKVK